MKYRSLLTLAILLSSFVGLNTATAAHHEEGHTELGEQMEVIGKTFRSLRRAVRDPAKNAESAAMVGKMLKAAKSGLDHEPAWKAEQPAGEQADFVANFKKEMKVFVQILTDLKAALEADNNDKANELIESLRDQQRSSHKDFKKPDED
ncbi:MAG: cytochrome b562 [Verrucomicrobiia bacterium]|tara:strand:- start:18 stop:464 length:447 start_codon:yes stop_codon:yes gene_type:complete